MAVTVNRRVFSVGGLAAIVAGPTLVSSLLSRAALAQGADLASLGLPTLDITITADAFEGVPAELASGRYLVTASIADDLDNGAFSFMRPPEGHTVDELLGIIGMFAQIEASPAATDMSATPAGGEAEMGGAPPSVVYQSTFAGGVGGPGGATMQVVIDLGPGEWILWGDDPAATQAPVVLTVTGAMPADPPEPESDITVTLVDFAISVEGNLTAGDHIVWVANEGAEPHFLYVMKGPDGLTDEQFGLMLSLPEGATPPADILYQESDFTPLLVTGTQSIGTSLWTTATLESGTYAAACYFPTAGTGEPHAMKGMHTVFTVS
jgi:hypothetical protein